MYESIYFSMYWILRFECMSYIYVKKFDEIAGSLDHNDSFRGVQFMPEMIKYCGTRQKILAPVKRVKSDKKGFTDKLGYLRDVYLLENIFCDGEYHHKCGRKCRMLWHQEWFAPGKIPDKSRESGLKLINQDPVVCQATSISNAMKIFSAKFHKNILNLDYLRETSLLDIVQDFFYSVYYLIFSRRLNTKGALRKTPSLNLGLKAGDRVIVKSFDEIKATLDSKGRNRGLGFQTEMIKFCGCTFTVSDIMHTAISEYADKVKKVNNSVLLDNTYCNGSFHLRCSRKCPHIWREIWLTRI